MSELTTEDINKGENYILGTDPDELDRLGFQHKVWSKEANALWLQMGLGQGKRVLDLGCGPGFATFDLGTIVGREGSVYGIDKSPGFIEYARHQGRVRGFENLEFIEGDFNEMTLEGNSFDAAYCRWALCWMDEPQPVVQAVADALKPGGLFGAQEYAHWGSFSVYPEKPEVRKVIEACRESWRVMDGQIDMGPRLIEKFNNAGLEVVHMKPLAKFGKPGQMPWQWPSTFFKIYTLRLIEIGLLTEQDRTEFLEVWAKLESDANAFVITPMMMEVVGRKR
jgi:ubiquinone/menaquinone biosynthesis C-methylase UbiE